MSELGFDGFSKWTSVLVLAAMVVAFRLGMVVFTQVCVYIYRYLYVCGCVCEHPWVDLTFFSACEGLSVPQTHTELLPDVCVCGVSCARPQVLTFEKR